MHEQLKLKTSYIFQDRHFFYLLPQCADIGNHVLNIDLKQDLTSSLDLSFFDPSSQHRIGRTRIHQTIFSFEHFNFYYCSHYGKTYQCKVMSQILKSGDLLSEFNYNILPTKTLSYIPLNSSKRRRNLLWTLSCLESTILRGHAEKSFALPIAMVRAHQPKTCVLLTEIFFQNFTCPVCSISHSTWP